LNPEELVPPEKFALDAPVLPVFELAPPPVAVRLKPLPTIELLPPADEFA
jgi:hypothetical protein